MTSKGAWILLGSVGVAALATAPEATAQQISQATAGSGLEEIVVTARRREENIQSVPIAITAFSTEEIRERRITTNADIGKLVPSYQVREVTRGSSNGPGSQQSFIRGLPGVQTYYAEVPAPILGPALFFDLQNIQALVGPQGTLFGLGATGGAILVEPKKPTNQFEGYVEATLGSYSWRTIEGALNIPLVDDKVLVRVAGLRDVRDGFTKVLDGLAPDLDSKNDWSWRAAVTLRPTESIENYFLYTGRYFSTTPASSIMVGFNPSNISTTIVGRANMQAALDRQNAIGPRAVSGLSLTQPNNAGEMHMFIDTLTYEVTDEWTIKNIASLRRSTGVSRYDSDGTPLRLFGQSDDNLTARTQNWTRNYSDELQVQADLFGGKLDWVGGAFYAYSDIDDPQTSPSVIGYAVGLAQRGSSAKSDNKTRTQGLFTQGTLDLSLLSESLDGLKFTAGYRYSWDYQSFWEQSIAANGVTCTSAFAAPGSCIQVLAGKFKAPSWTFALDYQVQPDVLAYVTSRRGYSTGTFNPQAPTVALREVDPEFNTDVEIGVKTDWTLGTVRGRTNVSLFHVWYDNVQRVSSLVFTNNAGNQQTIALNQNAAKAKIKGFEVAALAQLTPEFELSGNYQYLKSKYVTFSSVDSAGNPVNLSGRPFGDSPRHRLNITAKYTLPLDESLGDVALSGTYSYKSKVFTEAGLDTPFDSWKGFGTLDMRIDWSDIVGSGVDASVFVSNLTNELYPIGFFPVWNSLGFHAWTYAEPRMWGAQLRYRF